MNTPNDKQLQLFSTLEPPPKSSFYDWEIDQQGTEKSINGSGSSLPLDEANKLHLNDNTNTLCSDTWISFQDAGASAWQQSNLGEYKQPSLLKSTSTLKQSSNTISQESLSIPTSETTTPEKENSICSQWDSPAQAHQTQEAERDYLIQLPLFGEKDLDVLSKLNPASVLSSNLKELSNEDFELFLADSLWQDTVLKLKQSRRESLARVIKDSDYLSFPTLTSNASSTNSRPAGQTKCEKWFKDNGLIPNGSQLGTRAIALMMGFPSSWFEGLTQQYSKNPTTPNLVKPQAESEQDIWQDEQLHQPKQRSPSAESSTSTQLLGGEENSPLSTESSSSVNKELSIPCLVKQPKQLKVKGIIRKDEGDRFLVEIDGKEISISKLFVYPDLNNCSSKNTAENNAKVSDTSVKCSSKTSPLSICGAVSFRTKCSSKTRRQKGEGSGHIYYRTVTRNGKSYQQAYYQWRENGRQRTKYISKKLLSRVEEAESKKLPIADILVLLGGINKCSSTDKLHNDKSSDTSIAPIKEKVIDTNDECSSKVAPPSKRKRKQGEGTGYIECKPIKRTGKEYKQYWYHYEEWREGDRLIKKSRYIPKRLVARVEKMNDEKVLVAEILKVLRKR